MQFFNNPITLNILLLLAFIWSLIWKGLAMWRAATSKQKNWFIVLLVINTFGILEIVYLFRFAKKKMTIKELKTLVVSLVGSWEK